MTTARSRKPAERRAEKARARAVRRPKTLGLDAIVDVTLRIVDREGVDAVSMRRVAAEFDTGPASLYAYVANKDELLRLVLDRAITEITVPDNDDWQQLMRGYGHAVRAEFQRHNDIAKLNFAHIPVGAAMLDTAEHLLGAMIGGGVPPQVAAWALDVISLYITADAYEGWLYARRFADGSGRDPEELGAEYIEGIGAEFASLSAERYPNLRAHRDIMVGGSSDERFAFGLDMLIAGIAAQVPTRRRAGGG